MFDIRDLQAIKILCHLDDPLLEKIATVTEIENFRANDYIYQEGDPAEKIYAIIQGKVGLEVQLNSSVNTPILQITRRQAFGVCGLVGDDGKYISHAHAETDVTAYSWKISALEALFKENYELGFHFLKRIAMTITNFYMTKMTKTAPSV